MTALRWLYSWLYTLTMWVGAWGLWAYQRVKLYYTRRNPNMVCPACGARSGKIHWDPMLKFADGKVGALVHRCEVCSAMWGEPPIVASKEWMSQQPVPQGDPVPWSHGPQSRSFEGLPKKEAA